MSQLFNNLFRRQRLPRQRSRRAKLWLEHLESRIVLDARLSIFVDSEQIEIPANIGVDDDGQALSQVRTLSDNGTLVVAPIDDAIALAASGTYAGRPSRFTPPSPPGKRKRRV